MIYSTVLLLDCTACALIGGAAAFRGGRHSLPLAGAIILGSTCALITPIVRTVMILVSTQIMPQADVFDERVYVAASLAGACAGYLLQRRAPEAAWFFPVLESAALALATALGTYIALAFGLASSVWSVIIGCMAGAAGGVLRDLCLAERPALLEVEFYGSAAVVGAMAVTGLHALQADFWVQMAMGFSCVFALKLFGSWRTKRGGFFSEF